MGCAPPRGRAHIAGSAQGSVDSLPVRTRSSLEGSASCPSRIPKEFRRDVIAVARQGDQSIAQVAKSFGISESCLSRWLRDRRPRGRPARPAVAGAGAGGDLEAENRELRRRDQAARAGERDPAPGDGLLRPRHPPKMMYPLVRRPCRRRHPRRGDLPGARLLQAGLLPVAGQPGQPARLGRRAPDQRRDRHPPRRPEFGYRFIADELAGRGITRQPQPGQPAVHPAADLVRSTPRSAA